MKAVILVGGEGTRLRPLTYELPKPMLPVLNRPFLEHVIAPMHRGGVEEVILAAGYLPATITGYFTRRVGTKARPERGEGIRLTYSVEDRPLGTAGAVKNAERHLDGTFAVFNGDLFADLDLRDMVAFHRRRKARVTIAVTRVNNPCAFGLVETGPEGAVRRFVEKPDPCVLSEARINAGFYVIEPEVLAHVPSGTHYTFERGLFPLLIERGEAVLSYELGGYWIDMGTPAKYLRLNCDLLEGRAKSALIENSPANGISVGEGCSIHTTARVEGPVLMGRGCRVSRHACIRGPAVLGPDCYVGEGATVERSVLWQGVKLSAGAGVRESILGRGLFLKREERLANRAVVSARTRRGETRSVSFVPE